jgi:hypothetical protein
MSQHLPIALSVRLRFEGLILAEANRLKGQADLLTNLDEEFLRLAREYISDERNLVTWLVGPTHWLDGTTPLAALGSEEGRRAVVAWFEQVGEGGFQ